jgi:hypothetical protein
MLTGYINHRKPNVEMRGLLKKVQEKLCRQVFNSIASEVSDNTAGDENWKNKYLFI